MGQKFFISFNSADRTKAHWIAWTLKEAGHAVAVHDWEIPAGGNVPLWMNSKLAWADRLIAVISPDYVPARYSPMEWASQIWNDPDGTKGSVIPVIVRPTSKMPLLLQGLSRIDLTNCSEDEARRRLIKAVDMPAPPELKPAFELRRNEIQKVAALEAVSSPPRSHPLRHPILRAVPRGMSLGTMRRLGVLGGAAGWPLAARAQQPARPVLGFVAISDVRRSSIQFGTPF
jgi:hypothetical protein